MVVENPTCSTFWVFLLKNNSHEMIAWSQSCCVGFCSVCMYEVYYWSFVWCQRVWMFWRRRFDFLVGSSAMIIIVKTIFCSRSWRAALREKIGRWRSHFLLPTPGWDMVTYLLNIFIEFSLNPIREFWSKRKNEHTLIYEMRNSDFPFGINLPTTSSSRNAAWSNNFEFYLDKLGMTKVHWLCARLVFRVIRNS